MIARTISRLARAATWGILLVAIAVPAFSLIARCIHDGQPPTSGFGIGPRQLTILARSAGLAAIAAIASCLLAIPPAAVIARLEGRRSRVLAFILFIQLLCPSMVYAFGWEKLLPNALSNYARCVLVWSFWSWPVPAMLLGAAYTKLGARSYEAALLETSSWRAFLFASFPAVRTQLLASLLMLFVIFLNDTAVPDASAIISYSTELLGWASSSTKVIDVVWPAIFAALPTAFMLWIIFRIESRADAFEISAAESGRAPSKTAISLTLLVFIIGWLLPLGALCVKHASLAGLSKAWQVYGHDVIASLLVAASAGVVVTLAAACIGAARFSVRGIVFCTVLYGLLPGAVVGTALIAAYNRQWLSVVYDYWPIVAICYVARFAWVGGIAALALTSLATRALIAHAHADGADDAAAWRWIVLPLHARTLLACGGIVAALSIAEVAASDLVRVPGYQPIASIIIEKFHRFEDDMLVSLTLMVVGMAVIGVGAFAALCRTGDAVQDASLRSA